MTGVTPLGRVTQLGAGESATTPTHEREQLVVVEGGLADLVLGLWQHGWVCLLEAGASPAVAHGRLDDHV